MITAHQDYLAVKMMILAIFSKMRDCKLRSIGIVLNTKVEVPLMHMVVFS